LLGLPAALLAVGLAPPAPAAAAAQEPARDEPARLFEWTLGSVEIRTRDVYSDEEAERSFLARAVDATHATTRVSVVRRELWIEPGEPIRVVDAEELERVLRRTGLFAEVRVELRPSSTPGVADLVIETEDRLSLLVGAAGSLVGAVTSVGAAVGESNLFGSGDRVALGYSENSAGESRGAFSYRDRHVLGTHVRGDVRVGRTDEGDFGSLAFERPFRVLVDRYAWRAQVGRSEGEVDYHEAGDTVAEVPRTRASFSLAGFERRGPPERAWTFGLLLDHDASEFGRAQGAQADQIEVPGDTDATFAGSSLAYRHLLGFRKVRGLDTLDYVQDLTLSAGAKLTLGATARSEEGEDDALQPTLGLEANFALEALEDTYVALSAEGLARSRAGELPGWSVGLDLRAFALGHAPHTLAARLAFDEAFEGEGLPIELTLGEDRGLRGYPSRELTGARVARLNLEDRIDLQSRIGSLELGAVAFFDVGWIAERGEGFGRPWRSLGCGLRIGSDELLGSGVVRIDLSFPLDDPEGRELDPLLSIALGQVFEF